MSDCYLTYSESIAMLQELRYCYQNAILYCCLTLSIGFTASFLHLMLSILTTTGIDCQNFRHWYCFVKSILLTLSQRQDLYPRYNESNCCWHSFYQTKLLSTIVKMNLRYCFVRYNLLSLEYSTRCYSFQYCFLYHCSQCGRYLGRSTFL